MASWLVRPSPPTGNNRRIELAGLDLWIYPRIDNVFVYPAALHIDRFKEALGQVLSLWPLVAGRFIAVNFDHYFIEMSDNGIPVTLVENNELNEWSLNSNVVVNIVNNPLLPCIDGVETTKLMTSPSEEPLLRLKLTHIVQSGEWIFGSSWAHVLGDAASNLNFLHTLSCVYQQLEPVTPFPIFQRRLWREEEADQSMLPFVKELSHAKPIQEMFESFFNEDGTYQQLNLHFTGKQLCRLRELVGDNKVTVQDALTSYLVLLLNTYCFQDDEQRRILRTNTAVNFRGVSDLIAPTALVSNAVVVVSSENFDDPLSLSGIAKTIRRSITEVRDPKFLERCVATADKLLKNMVRENRMPNLGPFPNDVTVNSNFRYDWASLVDFGYTDTCRFHTVWTGRLYFRVFRLNPMKYDGHWLPRDRDGAEVAFRIPKDVKDRFISAWERDVTENFSHMKL